jgi:hypothetical protein
MCRFPQIKTTVLSILPKCNLNVILAGAWVQILFTVLIHRSLDALYIVVYSAELNTLAMIPAIRPTLVCAPTQELAQRRGSQAMQTVDTSSQALVVIFCVRHPWRKRMARHVGFKQKRGFDTLNRSPNAWCSAMITSLSLQKDGG